MIAVISYPGDAHAERVMEHLAARGEPCFLLDLAQLPDRATLTVDYGDPLAPQVHYRTAAGEAVDLGDVSSLWWRRPQQVHPSSVVDPDVSLFTYNEWNEAVNGLWQLVPGWWMNHPVRDEVASRKMLQLRSASEVGLRTPRTLVTSDPDRAREFITAQGLQRTIFKTFSCTHQIWRETRRVRGEDLEMLDAVRVAPVIFQEFVEADVDVRITIIDGALFAAAIDCGSTGYDADFRMSVGDAKVYPVELPADVRGRLHALMDRLGLIYGAVDMRRTPGGEYVFLEVNTAGEFLFIEERTGQPISETLARCLATPGGP